MVIRAGQATDLVGTIEQQYAELQTDLGPRGASLMVAFHCYQRRLEVERVGEQERCRRAVADYPLIGFCTYGEQYNGLHMNQAAVGFVLGT
jgi:hypothetical protein